MGKTEALEASVPAIVPSRVKPPLSISKAKHLRWPWAVGAVFVLGLGGMLYFSPWGAAVPAVAVEVVIVGPATRILAVNGRVAGEVLVDVRPLVFGTLTEVRVAEGDVVEAGAVLATIDSAAQAAVVRQAMANLDAALVALAEAQATYARTDALGTVVARIILERAARTVQMAAQDVAGMTALLEQAQLKLTDFTIVAPIEGSVLVLDAEPGQTADLTTVLMTIADLSELIVKTDVDESYATQIKLGQVAVLQLAGETEIRSGQVSFVSQRVDEATGGLAIELTADTALSALVGLTVTANITVDERAAAITVPREAIVRDEAGDGVFVISGDTAIRRSVVLIDWPAARLIVKQGLVEGDVLITDATGIIEGQTIKAAP